MAKRCNVCKKTYPDNERSCPYCAEEADIVEEAIEVEETPSAAESKSHPKKPAQPGKMASAPKRTMQAGGEIDILAEEMIDEVAEVEEPASPRGKPAAAQLGEAADPKKTHLAAKVAPPTKLSAKAPVPTMLAPSDADADIVDAVIDDTPSSPSASKHPKARAPRDEADDQHDAVDLGALPTSSPSKSERKRASGVRPEADSSGIDLISGEALVEGASEINLGEMPGKGDRPSGLDLIAEAVESGVDLRKGKSKTGDLGHKSASVDEEAADLLSDDSSAVDLGSSGEMELNPFGEEAGSPSGSGTSSDRRKRAADSKVAAHAAEGNMNEPPDGEDLDERDHESSGGGGTAVAKAPPRPKYGTRIAGGILVGLLLGAGAVAGLASFTEVFGKKETSPTFRAADHEGIKTQITSANKKADDAENALKAAKEGEKKALDTSKAAQTEITTLKKQLEEEKGKNKSDKDLQAELAKVKADAKKSADSLLETTKLIDGVQASLKGIGFVAGSANEVPEQIKKLIQTKAADDAILNDASKTLKVDKAGLAAAVKKLDTDKASLDKDHARLDALVKSVRDKLKASKFLTGDAAKDEVVLAELDKALKQAVSPMVSAVSAVAAGVIRSTEHLPDLMTRIHSLTRPVEREALLGYYRLREPLIQTPVKMLDTWTPLLQDMDRKDAAALAKKASFDANWVKKHDLKATPADKAKADLILGLAERNQLNFAAAKKILEPLAAGMESPKDPAYKKQARQVLFEMTDPLAYYLRFGQLSARGHEDRLLAELDAAVKAAAPNQKGSLLALASLAHLAKARSAGKKLDAKLPEVALAEADAKAAITAGAAEEGYYALGQRAELLGDLNGALEHYKKAAKYKGRGDLASLYRLALARALLQVAPSEDKTPAKAKSDKAEAKGRESTKTPTARQGRSAMLKKVLAAKAESQAAEALLLMLDMVLLAPDDDEESPRNIVNIDQAIRLAREAIGLGDPNGYLVLGIALTQKSEWTKGLKEYAIGLEKLYPGPATRGLRQIVEDHPAFKLPDGLRPPQPLEAERHYGAGLNYFWGKKYGKAEEEFKEAVKFFDRDARYYYYLGLSQLLQTPARLDEARECFRMGNRLERQGNPESEAVNDSLERVQGKPRRIIDAFRE